MLIENVTICATPFIDPRAKCQGCDLILYEDEIPENMICPCKGCKKRLIDDALGSLKIEGDGIDGGSKVTILLSRLESPRFFDQLDRTLRVNFGISLAAVGGCDAETARYIGCRSGYKISDQEVEEDSQKGVT